MARKPHLFSMRTMTGTCLVLTIALATGCNTTGSAPSPFSPYGANGPNNRVGAGTPTPPPPNSPTARSQQPMPKPEFPQSPNSPTPSPRISGATPAGGNPSARLAQFDPSTGRPVSGAPMNSVPGSTPMPASMTSLPTSPGSLNPNFPAMPQAGVRMPDSPSMPRPIASTSTMPPSFNPQQFPQATFPQQPPNPASAFGAPTGPSAPNLNGSVGTTFTTPVVQ